MGYEEFRKGAGLRSNLLRGLSVSIGPRTIFFSEEAARHLNGKVVCMFDPNNRKMAFRPADTHEFNGYSIFKPRRARCSQLTCEAFVTHVFGKGKVEKQTRYRATWNGTLLEVDLTAGPIA